jgi:predicted hotdog family 3-hydroxylacyl-ACP dehydratase
MSNMSATELPEVRELVPHRGKSLLLDCLLAHDGESTTARVVVGGQSWLTAEDGSVASWLALEYMAQCVAAHEGLLARIEGCPPVLGFLVNAVGVRIELPRFEAGQHLRLRAQRVRGRPGLGVLSHLCTVHAEGGAEAGRLLAEGRLSVSRDRSSDLKESPDSRSDPSSI